MQILIIDNNIEKDCWGASNLSRLASLASLTSGATIHTRRAPHDDLPQDLKKFDRFILSGSLTSVLEDAPWIDRLLEAIRTIFDSGKPALGVCYGHQMFGRVLGGKQSVRRSTTPEFGWTKIQATQKSRLTEGLPKEFYSFSSHFDEVHELPRGTKKILSSERCEVQGFEVEGKPIFGIQFHPEKNLVEAEKILQERREKSTPFELLSPTQGKKLYTSEIGEVIFKNFIKVGAI